MMITRRRFIQCLGAGMAAGTLPGLAERAQAKPTPEQKLRVAAIQMQPELANVGANLQQAECLIREAQRKRAEWIALPELFTTAAAFHPDMLSAIRPIDGEPARLLSRLARQGHCTIGGSFLARRDVQAYNSFLLVSPDGLLGIHDKDYPSFWENSVCRGGNDDGVLSTPIGDVGAALCWELIRSQTARRLLGRVRFVMGGSCWWTLPDDADSDHPLRQTNLEMLHDAPVRFARMLGVPVIHGSHSGPFSGFVGPDLPDVPYESRYLGETMVVDADGHILGRRSAQQGAGIVITEITVPGRPAPSQTIPGRFWIPEAMPQPWKDSWKRWLDSGSHYYRTVTEPYLETGQIAEYVPEYMH